MFKIRKCAKIVSALLIPIFLSVGLALPVAQAEMIGTDKLVGAGKEADRDALGAYLQRGEVRRQLVAMGVSVEHVNARIAALSDEEVANLRRDIARLPAGGSAGIIFVLLAVFALVDFMGYPDFLSADFWSQDKEEPPAEEKAAEQQTPEQAAPAQK